MHIKKKLAHVAEYLLPHCNDNSDLCRWHKLNQLPISLSSSKFWICNVAFFLESFKLHVWSDCNVWQVGIALHYSSLSTLLWIGVSARVIYKEAVWRMPRQPDGESPVPPTQRPMLRSVSTIQPTFAHFVYHDIIVCCQWGLCIRETLQFLCVATQTVLDQGWFLCPTAKGKGKGRGRTEGVMRPP